MIMMGETQLCNEKRVFISSAPLVANNSTGDMKFVRILENNGTQEASSYLVGSGVLEECMAYKPRYSSWFVDDSVVSQGVLHISTPVDPLFFVLRGLTNIKNRNNTFCDLEEIVSCIGLLGSESSFCMRCIQEMMEKDDQMRCLCDFKEVGKDRYYRLNEEKVVAWLILKVKALQQALSVPGSAFEQMDENGLKLYCVSLISEYLPDDNNWISTLKDKLNLENNIKDTPGDARILGPHEYDPDAALRWDAEGCDQKKRPRLDPKAIAKAKAAEGRAAIRAAKLAKEACGMRKLSSFFQPRTKP